MDEQLNPLERDHSLCVVLPGGLEKKATVHGSKPVMDLLVTLCASYHLNPSDYTVELLSPNKNNISFKPNSAIGSLEAEKIVLKPKGVEENTKPTYMPEATVRLLINYNKSHKTVVRVNPRVPLEMLLPVVCDKCEFKVETTILLRDCQSNEPLDMNKTLNDHGLREVFARDTAGKEPNDHQQHNTTPEADLPKKEQKQKENTGFLSLFRRKKKKNKLERTASAPASPGLSKQAADSVNAQALSSCNNLPGDISKKRPAPPPPMGVSQSVPNNLSTCHLSRPQRSANSTMRSTKRKAPPPPCANTHPELQEDTKGTVDSLNTLEELRESDESDSVNLSLSSSSSPCPSKPWSSSSSSRPSLAHLHEAADPYLPSLRGKDISDARCALANILTSSVSKGLLVKRLRNSATFPKFHNSSSVTRQCPDTGVVCAELESVLNSKLPTEPEWEDPIQKKGLTTFKVVPSQKHQSYNPEVNLDAPDQCQKTEDNNEHQAPPDANNQTEIEAEVCSPPRSEPETPFPDQELSSEEVHASDSPDSPPPQHVSDDQEGPGSPLCDIEDTDERLKEEDEGEVSSEVTAAALSEHSEEVPSGDQINSEDQSEVPQSPRKDMDQDVEEEVVLKEEEEEGEEDLFPPPPPPVFFNEDLDIMEPRDDTTSSVSSPQSSSAACNGQTEASTEDHRDESTPAAAAPKPPDKTNAAPSRFAQAVALAVQRSRLQRQGQALGPQPPSDAQSTLEASTHRSTYQCGA